MQGGDKPQVKAAGAPNIKGVMSQRKTLANPTTGIGAITGTLGCFSYEHDFVGTKETARIATTDAIALVDRIHFDASSSNSIYGNSTTVQPPSLQLIPQIRC